MPSDLTHAQLAKAAAELARVITRDEEQIKEAAREIGKVSLAEMEGHAADGHFASGSMGPKVEAALRFVRNGGTRSVITALDLITDGVEGRVGTVIENPEEER